MEPVFLHRRPLSSLQTSAISQVENCRFFKQLSYPRNQRETEQDSLTETETETETPRLRPQDDGGEISLMNEISLTPETVAESPPKEMRRTDRSGDETGDRRDACSGCLVSSGLSNLPRNPKRKSWDCSASLKRICDGDITLFVEMIIDSTAKKMLQFVSEWLSIQEEFSLSFACDFPKYQTPSSYFLCIYFDEFLSNPTGVCSNVLRQLELQPLTPVAEKAIWDHLQLQSDRRDARISGLREAASSASDLGGHISSGGRQSGCGQSGGVRHQSQGGNTPMKNPFAYNPDTLSNDGGLSKRATSNCCVEQFSGEQKLTQIVLMAINKKEVFVRFTRYRDFYFSELQRSLRVKEFPFARAIRLQSNLNVDDFFDPNGALRVQTSWLEAAGLQASANSVDVFMSYVRTRLVSPDDELNE